MKLHVYSVFDKAVGAYMQPFFARAKGEAIRSFSEACADEKHNFHKYAADYVMVELGEFDDHTGLFVSREPMRVISALECVVVEPEVFTEDKRVQ